MIIDSQQYDGRCSCGRSHKMETEFCVIESGALKKLSEYTKKYGLQGYTVAVYDENTFEATTGQHPQVDYEIVLPAQNLHANEHGVALLKEKLPEKAELLLAVGAGTVHDITRYCAYEKQIPFVSCPTAASVDGFCSSVAAMTWNGCKKTLTAVAPRIVVADLDIIKKAPIRLARSGFGDMVGKYVSLTDWRIGNLLTGEFYCDRIAALTGSAAENVLSSAKGILTGDEKAYENLMYGLLLSGLAMQMMGNSRPASGAEHHMSHFIEMQGAADDALHGEKVGVGTLLAIQEYQRMCALPEVSFKDYESFSAEVIGEQFDAETAQSLMEENRMDSASGITAGMLKENWENISREVAKLPDLRQLKDLYKELGVKATLPEIGVPADMEKTLLLCSPMVRNRLTLMRLRRCMEM